MIDYTFPRLCLKDLSFTMAISFRISFLLHFDEQEIRLQQSNIERETLTANFLQDAHKLIKNTILAVN